MIEEVPPTLCRNCRGEVEPCELVNGWKHKDLETAKAFGCDEADAEPPDD